MVIINACDYQTSSVEIERVCNRADENVLETAAVTITSRTGGPEQLVVLVVPKNQSAKCDPEFLRTKFQKAIQNYLNPLFKVLMPLLRTFMVIYYLSELFVSILI